MQETINKFKEWLKENRLLLQVEYGVDEEGEYSWHCRIKEMVFNMYSWSVADDLDLAIYNLAVAMSNKSFHYNIEETHHIETPCFLKKN